MYCVDRPVITKDHLGVSIKGNRLSKECNNNCHFNCVRILELDVGPVRTFLHSGVIPEYQSKIYHLFRFPCDSWLEIKTRILTPLK